MELLEHWHSALYLTKKVLPGIFCYQSGVIFSLAFPDVEVKPYTSKVDTRMLRDICQILVAFDSRVAEDWSLESAGFPGVYWDQNCGLGRSITTSGTNIARLGDHLWTLAGFPAFLVVQNCWIWE